MGAASFEESARRLAVDLRARGDAVLAAWLIEVVPVSGVVRSGELRELLAERLRRIGGSVDVSPQLRTTAARLAGAAADPMRFRGRTGTVWIAWDDGDDGPGGPPPYEPGYVVSWQADREDGGWWEDGPSLTELRDALAWARARTDSVVVRPSWDHGRLYWAGSGPDWRDLPPLDESRG